MSSLAQLWLLLFLVIATNVLHSDYIDCTANSACKDDDTLACAQDGSDCTVVCGIDGTANSQSCFGATINCADDVPCNIECIGHQACFGIEIYGNSASEVNVITTIHDTFVYTDQLYYAVIDCENAKSCNVVCESAFRNCIGLSLNGESSTSVTIECSGPVGEIEAFCADISLWCPIAGDECHVTLNETESMTGLQVYAQTGFNIFAITAPLTLSDVGNIDCESGYSSTCPISNDDYNSCDETSTDYACDSDATSMPTTAAPTTPSPTTSIPTTGGPTTDSPTTAFPTTTSPTTKAPTTSNPTTQSPTSASPTTSSPTTSSPTTGIPTTDSPTTASPVTASPITASPTTRAPTFRPTSASPTTNYPTVSLEYSDDYTVTVDTNDPNVNAEDIAQIVVTSLEESDDDLEVTVVSSEVDENGDVVIVLTIQSNTELESAEIKEIIEDELDDEVTVEENDNNESSNQDLLDTVIHNNTLLIMAIISMVLLILCILFMVLLFLKYRKNKRNKNLRLNGNIEMQQKMTEIPMKATNIQAAIKVQSVSSFDSVGYFGEDVEKTNGETITKPENDNESSDEEGLYSTDEPGQEVLVNRTRGNSRSDSDIYENIKNPPLTPMTPCIVETPEEESVPIDDLLGLI